MIQQLTEQVVYKDFHVCCGIGGGAKGFRKANARLGKLNARFECLGGVDNDPWVINEFDRLSGVKGTVLDLFSREQYVAFHGNEPPAGWKEATPEDIRRASGFQFPNVIFSSPPCQGFSGLLAQSKSTTSKYVALNELALRTIWLSMEAFKDDPPEFYLIENVPRIANRGRHLIDQIKSLFRHYGFAAVEGDHNCGEIGGLAQNRQRFFMIARNIEKVKPFLYEPPKRRVRAVGELLSRTPLPGDPAAGPMHRVPSLHWSTWVRLAFVQAGKDWRSLKDLKVKNGYLTEYLLMPLDRSFKGAGYLGVTDWNSSTGAIAGASRVGNGAYAVADPREVFDRHGAYLGVNDWRDTSGAIAGRSHPSNGGFSVADPRPDNNRQFANSYQVVKWDQNSGTVIGRKQPSDGAQSVADPRHQGDPKFNNCFRVVEWEQTSPAVTGGAGPSAGGLAVADPRTGYPDHAHTSVFSVTDWDNAARTVTGASHVTGGALCVADPRPDWQNRHSSNLLVVKFDQSSPTVIAGGKGVQGGYLSVADPRPNLNREKGDNYLTAGHYGVVPWDTATGSVSGSGQHDNGAWSVADPRLPGKTESGVFHIRSIDDTWHRPFTTFELAVIQSIVDPEDYLTFEGSSDAKHRKAIGNAVPPAAAQAIGETILHTLLLARAGETFMLSNTPIWVRPFASAIAIDTSNQIIE